MSANLDTSIPPRRLAALALLLANLLLASGAALAQAYPSRPVKMIVPFAAGGPTDIYARLMSSEMTAILGQSVIVENRPGAGGAIGAEVVAKSAPDGYTVCFCPTGATVLMPLLEPKLPYNAARDLPPVGEAYRLELAIILGPRVAAGTLAELIALAKANPGKINFATAGAGSTSHLAGELLKSMAGIDMVHVPYKGEHPAMVDLIGGQVDMMIASVFIGEPQVKAGKARMIAITGPTRAERFPDMPTIAETIPGFEATSYFGLHVSAGTPKDIIDKLSAAMATAVAQSRLRERMLAEGITPLGTRPEAYAEHLRLEREKWSALIKQKGISLR